MWDEPWDLLPGLNILWGRPKTLKLSAGFVFRNDSIELNRDVCDESVSNGPLSANGKKTNSGLTTLESSELNGSFVSNNPGLSYKWR